MEQEKEIEKEEVKKAIKKLKDRKASGIDEMPREAWMKYEGEEIER